MDKSALVSIELARGSEVVAALERRGIQLNVALWLYASEYPDWRLVVSSSQLSRLDLRQAYRLINDALDAEGFSVETVPPILILPLSDRFVKELRRMFGKTKSVEGMRLGGQMIGDRFVEDAFVYRVS